MSSARRAPLVPALLLTVVAAATLAQSPAEIAGRVTAADGTPLRGAQIDVQSGDALHETVTDADGRFVVRLAPGEWRVTGSKAGFLPQQVGERRPLGNGTPVRVGPGEQVELALALSPASAITGTILDEYGEPVAGAIVQAVAARMRGARRQLTTSGTDRTDDTGRFRLHSLPSGDYYVRAALQASVPEDPGLPTYYPGTPDVSAARQVSLSTGEVRGSIDISLVYARPVRVSGVVVDSTGAPARDAPVELLRAGDLEVIARPFGNFGLSQADGSVTFLNVPPGAYVLLARVDRPPPDLTERAFVPVTVGSNGIAGVTVATRAGATLEGTVTHASGDPLPASFAGSIVARPTRGIGETRTSRIEGEGRFLLRGLYGPYAIGVDDLPAGWTLQGIELNGTDVTDRPVELQAGGRFEAHVTVTRQVSGVRGSVQAGDASPDTVVVVFPADRSLAFPLSRYVRTAAPTREGRFQITGLPPQPAYLIAAVDGFEPQELHAPNLLERVRGFAVPVSVDAGSLTDAGTLAITRAAAVLAARR